MSLQPVSPPSARPVNWRPFVLTATVLLALLAVDGTYLAAKAVLPPPAPVITTNGVYATVLDAVCSNYISGNNYPYQDIRYIVKVQNSGGTGWANVAFEVDGNVQDATVVHVGGGTFVWVTDIVYMNDCATHTTSAEVISEWA